MKTPWRFVADLVSRKPKPHGHEESLAVEPKTIALEYKPAPEKEQPSLAATVVERLVEPVSEAQAEESRPEPDTNPGEVVTAAPVAAEAPATPVDEEEPAVFLATQKPEEEASAPPQTEAAETLVKPGPARRRKVKPIAEPAASANQTDELAPAAAVGPKSFTDEMADLDAEVDALRRQLAKKLVEQNAQLRKMLGRFDPR